MEDFLSGIDTDGKVVGILKENDVDMEVLLTMTEDDMKELGISFGMRRKIKLLINKMRKAKPVLDADCKLDFPVSVNQVKEDDMEQREPPKKIPKNTSLRSFMTESKNRNATGLVKYLDIGGVMTIQQRRLLVRVSVSYLVEKCGLWPSNQEKLKLALEIVQTWHSVKDKSAGLQGHECYYDNGSGFIQTRLKNIRVSKDQRLRVRRGSPPGPSHQESDEKVYEQEEDKLEDQQMLEKKSSLRSFMTKFNNRKTTALVTYLDNGGVMTIQQRRLLVRLSVLYLVEKCGLWPSDQEKSKLAVEIVQTWPSVKDRSEGLQGHECYYDNGSGFIQTRLKNIRVSQDQRLRVRRGHQAGPSHQGSNEELDEQTEDEMEDQQILEKNSSLRSFMTESKNRNATALVYFLDNGGVMTIQQRRLLVRLSVSCLVEKCGLWPSDQEKSKLAREIVQTWHSVKDKSAGLQGHECYYDNGSGFIQTRLKNIRTSQDQRLRVKREPQPGQSHQRNDEEADDEEEEIKFEDQQKVEWMKYTVPTKENKPTIKDCFVSTHRYRQMLLTGKEPLSITELLKIFPRYKDMPELINAEFELLYPTECDNFIKTWGTFYRERIISLAKKDYPAVQQMISEFTDGDKDLCGITALVYMLHRPVSRRKGQHFSCSRAGAMNYLIQNVPEGTNVQVVADRKESRYSQPYILSVGMAKKPSQYFLILDKTIVSAGANFLESFDCLFKSYDVFNVDYFQVLQPFYQFVAAYIYNVLPPSQAKASVRCLAGSVTNFAEV